MSYSSTLDRSSVSPASSRSAKNVAIWTVQVVAAAMFLMGGLSKLAGAPDAVALFEAVGIGQWFRYVTGGIEVAGALLLLVPSLAGVGALALAGVMVGAILTHLFVIGGSAVPPLVLLAVVGTIAYARRERTLRLLGRGRPSSLLGRPSRPSTPGAETGTDDR